MNLENARELSRSSHIRYGWAVNNKRGRGGGFAGVKTMPVRWHFYFAKPRLQLQLSTTSQMCHFTCCGKMRKLANSVNDKLLIFIPLSKKHSCLSEFNMSRALKSEQKEAIFTLVLEKMRNGSRRSLFGLVTQHALSLTGNRGRCETRLNNSCDNSGRGTDTFYFCLGVFSQ